MDKKPEIPLRVLFVDDEENILRSLKRLFMGEDYDVLTATSGAEGLAVLKSNEVPVMVSDQRMPGMSGAEFLEKAREISPDSVRIILTGYADVEAAIGAINRGGAYRYVTKPWNDAELLMVVRDGVEKYRLVKENKHLNELTQIQNEELKKWSAELELYVQQHTIDLTRQNKELKILNEKLRKNLSDIITSLTGLIELRDRTLHNHASNVTALSALMAKEMGLQPAEIEVISTAAQLHDIGKIGDSDLVLMKSVEELSPEEMQEYVKHPVRGQAAIDSIEDFREPGNLIRHHHEWYNGSGFPDKLKGEQIPLGSRIISIADKLDRIMHDKMLPLENSLAQIKTMLVTQFDASLYAPLVKASREVFGSVTLFEEAVEMELKMKDLTTGMVLAKDVRTGTGLLLLRKGTVLNEKNIETLRRGVFLDPSKSGIFVFSRKGKA